MERTGSAAPAAGMAAESKAAKPSGLAEPADWAGSAPWRQDRPRERFGQDDRKCLSAYCVDRRQQLVILAQVRRVLFNVRPAKDPRPIDQEIGTISVVPLWHEHTVLLRDLAMEIAEHLDRQAVLRNVFLERVGVVDADRENPHLPPGERRVVVAHRAELFRA